MHPPKKVAAIPAAVSEQIHVVELTAAEREAALKLPIKEALRELSQRTQTELNDHLRLMIEAYLQTDLVDPERQVRGRLSVVATSRPLTDGESVLVPPEQRGDTYWMDDTPIMWAGPVALSRVGDEMRADRSIRYYLQPRDARAANDG